MNSSSKVPPRFVPTLTDVVSPAVDAETVSDLSEISTESGEGDINSHATALDESLGRVAHVLSQSEAQQSAEPAAPAVPSAPAAPISRASFHSPWLADGLYVRSKPATIPHQLPPLPESLPPQQPFAESAEMDVVSEQVATLAEQQELAEIDASDIAEVGEMPEPDLPVAFDAEALPLLSDEYVESTEPVASEETPVAAPATEPAAQALKSDEVAAAEVSRLDEALDGPQAQIAQSAQTPQLTEDYLVHRLMQRVDLVLEKRLKEAIEQVVEAQTRSLVLRLREELESVVRHSVYEAAEAELALQAQENEK
ncbi:MAG: hypothetical protein RSE32_03350 [Comamonas sp.]|uniref:hypothetical protein n=1 Tax=Comamonas sp. TaxID=34028 RepID=UPI002FC9E925